MTKNIKSLLPHAYRLRLHLIFVSLIIVLLAIILPIYPNALNLELIKPYVDGLVPTASISSVHCTAVDPKACYAFIGITGLLTPIAALTAFIFSGSIYKVYSESKLFYSQQGVPFSFKPHDDMINKQLIQNICFTFIISTAWYWYFYINELNLITHSLKSNDEGTTLFYVGVWGFRLAGCFFAILNFVIFGFYWAAYFYFATSLYFLLKTKILGKGK